MEQRSKTLSLHEGSLSRLVQPLKNFFDEERVLDPVGVRHVNMSERSPNLASELRKMPQRKRCSLEPRFGFQDYTRHRCLAWSRSPPMKPIQRHIPPPCCRTEPTMEAA